MKYFPRFYRIRLGIRGGVFGGEHLCSSFYTSCTMQQPHRMMNMNRSVQTKWEQESRAATQKRTDYDFDKEQWMKQMRIDTMDCIVDPTITPIRYTSWKGIKRGIDQFITMRKLRDRRPDFDPKKLEDLFKTLKTISYGVNMEEVKRLQLITTHLEADRITKEIRTRMNDNFTNLSWKALRQQKDGCSSKASGGSIKSPKLNGSTLLNPSYQIEVLSFDLINSFMGQMSKEDWLQLTYRCEFKEKCIRSSGSGAFSRATSCDFGSSFSFLEDSCKSGTDSRGIKKASERDETDWVKQLEYPVFEVRLTDGFQSYNFHPFKIVGIVKKDGTRYGKDAQDASELRKQFIRSKKWF